MQALVRVIKIFNESVEDNINQIIVLFEIN